MLPMRSAASCNGLCSVAGHVCYTQHTKYGGDMYLEQCSGPETPKLLGEAGSIDPAVRGLIIWERRGNKNKSSNRLGSPATSKMFQDMLSGVGPPLQAGRILFFILMCRVTNTHVCFQPFTSSRYVSRCDSSFTAFQKSCGLCQRG